MKWPKSLVFIRHGESEYNVLKNKKSGERFEHFKEIFNRDFSAATDENWASDELKVLAREVWKDLQLFVSDYNTPLTDEGWQQAEATGQALAEAGATLPDVIYVSPYLRTRQTLEGIIRKFPALADVRVVPEERIREQEHGLTTVYNDWRVYLVFNPTQALLYKMETDYEYRYLNGENKADVRERVRSFIATLIRENAEENVWVVSHHLTLLSLRANLERWGREQFVDVDRNERPINCGVTTYRGDASLGQNGRLVLEGYNKRYY